MADTLIAHKAAAEGGAAAAEGEDEDDDEEMEIHDLISEASLKTLRGALERLKSNPATAAAMTAAVRGMKKKQKAAFAEFGVV